VPPSIASVYGRPLRLENAVALAISQSGASVDLALTARAARAGGALTLGLINEPDSALGREVDFEIQIGAGAEHAVAATKTFMLSVTAALHLVAMWSRDEPLRAALAELPGALDRCRSVDWLCAMRTLAGCEHAFVVARGAALPVAAELALKLEEVPGLLANAQSAAELLHGPIVMASRDMPAIVLAGDRHSRASVRGAMARLHAAGAPILLLSSGSETEYGAEVICVPEAGHELLQPLVSLYALYPALAQLARQRGRDPDRPPHLEKSIRTR
jgi:glucosamine--fructose-6-phosphate aminotransferase (isomerizing)